MARKYLNNYEAAITTATVGTSDLSFDVDIAPAALSAGDYYILTITDSIDTPTKVEIIKATGISGTTLIVKRGQESTTERTWASGDIVHLAATAGGLESLDGPEILQYTEAINASASAALDRSTGGIQHLDLTANTILDLTALSAGQSVMYRVTGGETWTLNYTGLGAWSNGAIPILSATHYLEFVHDGVEVVGFDCGGR